MLNINNICKDCKIEKVDLVGGKCYGCYLVAYTQARSKTGKRKSRPNWICNCLNNDLRKPYELSCRVCKDEKPRC